MGVHSNQTWLVFQSPILQDPEITSQYQHTTSQICTHSETFFWKLTQAWGLPCKNLLTPYALAHQFEAFRLFSSPTHLRALYGFLMECRANHIDEPFIETLQDYPLSGKLQQLFFLYYEYLLFKKNHPHLLDPWDVVQQCHEHVLPFGNLIWVDFYHTTTFSKQICQELARFSQVTPISRGPQTIKTHAFSLAHFVEIAQRLRLRQAQFHWVMGPNTQNLQAHVNFALVGQPVWTPTAFGSFDDIYGYLAHQDPVLADIPAHEYCEDLHARVVEDHVLPEILAQDPFWNHRPPTAVTEAKIQANLWTQYLALEEFKLPSFSDPAYPVLEPYADFLPDPQDLLFLDHSQLGCQLSPWCFSPTVQASTLVHIYSA